MSLILICNPCILEAAKDTQKYQRQWVEENGVKAMKKLKELGVKVNEVDKAAFQELAKPYYTEHAYPRFGKEMVDMVSNWDK